MGSRLRRLAKRWKTIALLVLLGWVLALTPLGNGLDRWSFDCLQLFLSSAGTEKPVIIYLDEQAMQDYGQKPSQWKRSLHADLLNRLTRDQPRLVVFDVIFSQSADADSDQALARAMHESGRVVLAGDRVSAAGGGYTVVPPLNLFETNTAAWGTAKVQRDADLVVRRYDEGDDQFPGLAWAAARVAGAAITEDPQRRLRELRWLNYYGQARPFRESSMTFTNAATREPGFYRGKSVFIGGQPETLYSGDSADVFGTPFTRWTGRIIPGVDITALAYANLMNEDFLRRLPAWAEAALFLLAGTLLGGIPMKVHRWTAAGLCFLGLLCVAAAAAGMANLFHLWFGWAILGLIQIPVAFLLGLRATSERRRVKSTATLPIGSTGSESDLATTRIDPRSRGPAISDHDLLRCIGEGAYGQVWLARNAIGTHHAVKVIYRGRFGNDAPYDRAFRGIQKFMPISRSHEGFIHVLHVGRNEQAGFFYYVMEPGDDQQTGAVIRPDSYQPKSLSTELRQRRTIPASEALDLMLDLTEALERLHQHHLIHRDIKPANIIYVNGRPKLADIDLVTDLSPHGDVSRIGTEGYMAPEGPGTAAADVFSLGRILYVMLTGKAPEQCPEFPTRLTGPLGDPLFMELHPVCAKACEIDLGRRYPSAARMREDLVRIAAHRAQEPPGT